MESTKGRQELRSKFRLEISKQRDHFGDRMIARFTQGNEVKVDLKSVGCESMDWTHLTQRLFLART
jgi:hypothetical protein